MRYYAIPEYCGRLVVKGLHQIPSNCNAASMLPWLIIKEYIVSLSFESWKPNHWVQKEKNGNKTETIREKNRVRKKIK